MDLDAAPILKKLSEVDFVAYEIAKKESSEAAWKL